MKTVKKGSQPSVATLTTSAPADFIKYQGEVFRGFLTVQPSQGLLDDLVESPKEEEALEAFYYLDEISPKMPPVERVFRRSEQRVIQSEISSKFNPKKKWYASRYSDGTWGVLYSAEDEDVALHECLFHKRKFYWEELQGRTIQIDLKIALLGLETDWCKDLTQDFGLDHDKLNSKDESGYPYCQKLAKKYREKGAKILRTPSARHEEGVCVPIFDPQIVHKDKGHLKYIKIVLARDSAEVFEGRKKFYF